MRTDHRVPPGRAAVGRRSLLAGAGAVLLGACTPAVPGDSSSPPPGTSPAPAGELPVALRTRLDQAMRQAMQRDGVPGAVAGVWVPGQGSWTAAAGVADRERRIPVTTAMTWPLRSVTKSFTVTLVLQLADERRLGLDDPLGRYVEGVTDGGAITLRQLAAMSSGNADYTGRAFVAAFTADPTRVFTLAELNGFVLGQPALFVPGTRHVYVNANTNLLGAVVERVTGQDFADVLEARILAPLGLRSTRYVLDAERWGRPHPVGYQPDGGRLVPQPDNLSVFGPAGSMVSDLEDARVWARALADGSLLRPATQAQRRNAERLEKGPPYDRYGLGMGETGGWWGHNGQGFGFTAAVFARPETGAGIAVFTNLAGLPSGVHPADQLFRRLAAVVDGA